MTPEQFLQKCEAAFAADEPQVIPAAVARAMCRLAGYMVAYSKMNPHMDFLRRDVDAFTVACKEIEA